MKKTIATVALALCLTVTVRADTAYVSAVSGLRLREQPSTEATIMKVLPFGEKVHGLIADGWMETQDGYLSAEFLSEDDPMEAMTFLGNWRITAYAWTGNRCANGEWPTAGYTVACNSLDFGTQIYIEGVGTRTVTDRGPGWLGNEWCDLYLGDTASCIQWGNQYRNVWLLPKETETP